MQLNPEIYMFYIGDGCIGVSGCVCGCEVVFRGWSSVVDGGVCSVRGLD